MNFILFALISLFIFSEVASTSSFRNPVEKLLDDSNCSDFCPVSACTDKHTAVLGGVDVVSFFKLPNNSYPGVAGVYPYVSVYNGYSFLFSSVENMNLFNANPTSYLPQYGGFCAHGVTGEFCPEYPWQKTCLGPSGNWSVWYIYNGKLYLNLAYGAQQIFLADIENNIRAGDKRWLEWWGAPDVVFTTNCYVTE